MLIRSLIACTVATLPAFASEAYWLGNPVPREQMRPMSTDRPDTTESPYTVDAGHFQVEAEALSWGRDHVDETTTTTLSSSANLKVGVLTWMDLQAVIGYSRVTEEDNSSEITARGVDDITLRLKMNMWGNDGGDTAACLMPFVNLPTHGSEFGDERHVTGGLIAPLSFTLPAGWESAVMVELDIDRNLADDGYAAVFVQTITASHDLAEDVGFFVELVNVAPAEAEAPAQAYADAGLTWGVTPDLQLDGGTNVGLTKDSEDVRFFLGASWRY